MFILFCMCLIYVSIFIYLTYFHWAKPEYPSFQTPTSPLEENQRPKTKITKPLACSWPSQLCADFLASPCPICMFDHTEPFSPLPCQATPHVATSHLPISHARATLPLAFHHALYNNSPHQSIRRPQAPFYASPPYPPTYPSSPSST